MKARSHSPWWEGPSERTPASAFPNYLFIPGGLDRMLILVTMLGIQFLMGWDGHPSNTPAEEIDAVRLVESSYLVEPQPFLKCGTVSRSIRATGRDRV